MSTSSLSCCSDKTIVQDKVCTTWAAAAATAQILYSDNIAQIISGTGYIKLETGTAPATVTFLRTGVVTPLLTLTIPSGGSSSFTITRFDTITLTSAAAAQGEFCITVRYSL